MNPQYPRRIEIAHLPTPVEKMERLTSHLGGPELFIKRDDQTGLALGGNKSRKLEFLAADALDQGCDHLITTGAPQSNHCRQTAAVAARLGLGCSLVLTGEKPNKLTGNLLLDRLLAAQLNWTGDRAVNEVVQEIVDQVRAMGNQPYTIPKGGSNVIGAIGYVLAMEELINQLIAQQLKVDVLVVASSSSGTQAGLVLGAKVQDFHGRITGISIDHPSDTLRTQVAALATATAAHLGMDTISIRDEVDVNDDYLGEGYGVMGQIEREAIQLVAQMEGILLDPVYTSRAMAGLIDLIRRGTYSSDQRILFWHTGGTPALFAYSKELL